MIREPTAPCRARPRDRGFTLIELVVVIIIIGILAAIAVPRYIALGTAARVAAVKTMASTLRSTAENTRVLCRVNPSCDYSAQGQHLLIGGRTAYLSYGWLLSGYNLEDDKIDGWINYAGFTASVPTWWVTRFTLDEAPDPTHCSVGYENPDARGPTAPIIYTIDISGC